MRSEVTWGLALWLASPACRPLASPQDKVKLRRAASRHGGAISLRFQTLLLAISSAVEDEPRGGGRARAKVSPGARGHPTLVGALTP